MSASIASPNVETTLAPDVHLLMQNVIARKVKRKRHEHILSETTMGNKILYTQHYHYHLFICLFNLFMHTTNSALILQVNLYMMLFYWDIPKNIFLPIFIVSLSLGPARMNYRLRLYFKIILTFTLTSSINVTLFYYPGYSLINCG